MHKLTNWIAKRSGPRITVYGWNEAGEKTKIPAISVDGPCVGRLCAPRATLAIMPDGTPVELL